MPHLGLDPATPLARDHARGYQTQEEILTQPEPRGEPIRPSVSVDFDRHWTPQIDPAALTATSQVLYEVRNGQGTSDRQALAERIPVETEAEKQGDHDLRYLAPDNPSTVNASGKATSKSFQRDFDDGANTLWTLYGNEAEDFDKTHIQTLKDDMNNILLFAGLFAATITVFIVDAKQDLKVSPADQMVYYQQQNVAMLAQISQQISSIAPQVVIPSALPPPYPDFHPSSSALRVNAFWFMALVFSLFAALLAILVQQWVRRYMRVFERYSDPLKSARLRQYLHEGVETWYMPVLAEAVPTLFHTSVFLFFIGIGDSVLKINTTVGVSTTIPIGISGLFYVFTSLSPIIWPQSPYQHSSSQLIWYGMQKLHCRKHRDQGLNGVSTFVSSNMTEGQMQLAMEEKKERKARDENAVSWLVDKITEDADMEPFVKAIPGSFNSEWGIDVWKGVWEKETSLKSTIENQLATRLQTDMDPSTLMPLPTSTPQHMCSITRNAFGPIFRFLRFGRANNPATVTSASGLISHPFGHPPSVLTPVRRNEGMRELGRRIGHMLEGCNNCGQHSRDEKWRLRTQACIETTALLICCANVDLDWFGDIRGVLRDMGSVERTDDLLTGKLGQLFNAHRTCLSIVGIRTVLDDASLQSHASSAVSFFASLHGQDGLVDDRALEAAKKIDRDFEQLSRCLRTICISLFDEAELTEDQVREKLRGHELQISELERIDIEADSMDSEVSLAWEVTNDITQGLARQLPGVQFDSVQEPISFGQVTHTHFLTTPIKPISILPRSRLRGLRFLAHSLRDIIEARNVEKHRVTLDSLEALGSSGHWFHHGRLMESQLALLQDLHNGGGFGVTVALFFVTLAEVLPKSSSEKSQYSLYVGTFKSITSDWKTYSHSYGTQKVILDVVYDLAVRLPKYGKPRGSEFSCPGPITDQLLELLRNVFRGMTGTHIDNAVERLSDVPCIPFGERGQFLSRAVEVIDKTRRMHHLP
ncbi:hypothetical protein BGW80DRAFT_1562490 [Lactifluus volemus]|nr:hypothetical protein BGW80DRAFT_1562490 [Lactifluus volemus]